MLYTDGHNQFETLDELLGAGSCFSVDAELLDFAKALTRKYGPPFSAGRNRTVWKTDKGNVIKVPRCPEGDVDNMHESSVMMIEDSEEDGAYTRSRCISVKGRDIAVAEFVHEMGYEDLIARYGSARNFPDWIGFVDGGQVGLSRDGMLKAFDYGLR